MCCNGRAKLPANLVTQLMRMAYIRDKVGANGQTSLVGTDPYGFGGNGRVSALLGTRQSGTDDRS